DLASLYDNSTDQHLYTANYTSVVTSNFFFEGQYSRKISATMDTGSRFTDLVKGTPISDRQKLIGTANPLFNSPTFCAVCAGGRGPAAAAERSPRWSMTPGATPTAARSVSVRASISTAPRIRPAGRSSKIRSGARAWVSPGIRRAPGNRA